MPSFKGNVSQIPISNIVQALFLNGQEGVLTVENGTLERKIRILKLGIRPLAGKVDDPDLLREALVKEKLLTAAQFNNAISGWDSRRGFPGDFLIRRRLITPEQVENQVRKQLEEAIYEVFATHDLRYEFSAGEQGLRHEMFDPEDLGTSLLYSVNGILMEVARREDEWCRMQGEIPDDSQILVPKGESLPPKVPDETDLPPKTYEQLARLINGERTISSLVAESALSRYEVYNALYRLKTNGWIRPLDLEEKVQLARKLTQLVKRREAVEVYQSVLSDDPEQLEARKQLVSLLERSSGNEAVLIEHYMNLAERLADTDIHKALGYVQKALRFDPHHLQALDKLISLNSVAGNHDAAMTAIRAAVKAAEATQSHDEGADILLRAVNFYPEETRLYHEIAQFYVLAEKKDEAVDCLKAVAQIYKQRGDHTRLRKTCEWILELDPDVGGRIRKVVAELKPSRFRKGDLVRAASWSAVVASLLAAATYFVFVEIIAREAFAQTRAEVETHLQFGRADRARRSVRAFQKNYPISLEIRKLNDVRQNIYTEEERQRHRFEGLVESDFEKLSSAFVKLKRLEQDGNWTAQQRLLESVVREAEEFLENNRPRITRERLNQFNELLTKANARLNLVRSHLTKYNDILARIKLARDQEDVELEHALSWRLHDQSRQTKSILIPFRMRTNPPGATVLGADGKVLGTTTDETGLIVRLRVSELAIFQVVKEGFKGRRVEVDLRNQHEAEVRLPKDADRFEAGGPIDGTSAEIGGRIFFPTRKGEVFCLEDGKQVWPPFRVPALDVPGENTAITGGVQVWNNILYFGSLNGLVYFLDATTGTPWKVRTFRPLQVPRPIKEPPTLANDRGVFAVRVGDYHIAFFDLKAAEAVDTLSLPAALVGSPRTDGRAFLALTVDRRLWRYDLPGGRPPLVFEFHEAGKIVALEKPPVHRRDVSRREQLTHGAIQRDTIFLGTGSGHVEAFDLASGRRLWKQATGPLRGPPTPSLDKNVALLPFDGELLCLDPTSGKEKWRTKVPGAITASGTLFRNSFYAGTSNGYILCIDIPSGLVVWPYRTEGASSPKPRGITCQGIRSRGYYYQGSDDGGLYRLKMD